MAKFIEKSDLENQELQVLPIRRGCSGMCACLGICKNIEGYISRKEYEEYEEFKVEINKQLKMKQDMIDDFNTFNNRKLNETFRTSTGVIIKKYMLLIWNRDDEKTPSLLIVFTSDNEDDLDISKGELADKIENTLGIKIDTDDFDSEIISTKDFIDDYVNKKNPNRININTINVVDF